MARTSAVCTRVRKKKHQRLSVCVGPLFPFQAPAHVAPHKPGQKSTSGRRPCPASALQRHPVRAAPNHRPALTPTAPANTVCPKPVCGAAQRTLTVSFMRQRHPRPTPGVPADLRNNGDCFLGGINAALQGSFEGRRAAVFTFHRQTTVRLNSSGTGTPLGGVTPPRGEGLQKER